MNCQVELWEISDNGMNFQLPGLNENEFWSLEYYDASNYFESFRKITTSFKSITIVDLEPSNSYQIKAYIGKHRDTNTQLILNDKFTTTPSIITQIL